MSGSEMSGHDCRKRLPVAVKSSPQLKQFGAKTNKYLTFKFVIISEICNLKQTKYVFWKIKLSYTIQFFSLHAQI